MATEKQIAANRANSQRSTGPKTESGRAIAKLNAIKHGGLSPLPVIPEVETQDAWETHLAGMLESLRPAGHLEQVLAERVAVLLWRMNRVVRFEREVTAVGQERVVEDVTNRRRGDYRKIGPNEPDEVRRAYRERRRDLGILAAMYRRGPDERMTGDEAEVVLCAVAAQTESVDTELFSMPEVVPDEIPWSMFKDWTVARVRQGVAAMAAAEGDDLDPNALLLTALQALQSETVKLQAEVQQVARDLDHLRRERLLPDAVIIERVSRYEAHLSRQLAQALHELQRLQVTRAGDLVPPPLVVDLTVSDSTEA